MQDRVSLYPGRVKLEPVAGQANLYDLTRADQPTQEGTPLNKATLLNDDTAALFGLDDKAVPDDVLTLIKTMIDTANENANTKAKMETISFACTGTFGETNPSQATFSFAPKILILNSFYKTRAAGLWNVTLDQAGYFDLSMKDYSETGKMYQRFEYGGNIKSLLMVTLDGGKTVRWWSDESAKYQFNEVNTNGSWCTATGIG